MKKPKQKKLLKQIDNQLRYLPKNSKAKQTRVKTTGKNSSGKSTKIDYDAHWQGMPEFTRRSIEPIKQLIVNFDTKEDMLKFSKLVGQPITAKTKSIYYPEFHDVLCTDKRWSDKKGYKRKTK